jgi:hypothetical protein
MRKALLLALILMVCATASFAAVGIKIDNANKGVATDLNFRGVGDQITNDGSTYTFNLTLAGTGNSGATSMTSTTLAVPVTHGYVRKAIANDDAFITGTLADGTPGQLLTIHITEQAGAKVFTVTPATSASLDSIGFDAAGEIATLWYVDDTSGWTLFGYTNATVTLEDGL